MKPPMQVISSGDGVAASLRGGVVALGNFDGFHAGHQAVVGRALARARAEGRPALVATFDPHPAKLFKPDAPPFALTRLDQKLELLERFGIDATVVMPFDRAFAAQSAPDFVNDWLSRRIGAAVAVSGADFTFGTKRSGDTASLAALGQQLGIAAEVVQAISDSDGVISSTRIRQALQAGDVATATKLLTRPFALRGVVQHGAKLGRTLGFPTANLLVGDYLRPKFGVYAVRARLSDGSSVGGVANLGIRPMIEPPLELLEAFLFDWAGDLYGTTIDVELVGFIRPEWKLDGLEALKAQIALDTNEARRLLILDK